MKVKAMFQVPLADTDGTELDLELDALEAELYSLFSGWTLLGYMKGGYQMADGTRNIDDNCAYMVVLEESRLGELEAVLRRFKSKTKQEAIYLEVQRSVDFRFIT